MPEPFHKPPEPPPNKALVWLARGGAVLSTLFLVDYVGFFLLPGIYTGSIQETTKFGKVLTYSREAGPISFWFTVGFHATVASLIAYLEYLFLVRARWIESNKSIDVAAEKIVAWINELSKKPLSLWVVGIVFGGFFYFLFTLFAKAGGH